jgi:DNA polymerase III psi subunit
LGGLSLLSLDLEEMQVAILVTAKVSHWPHQRYVTVWTISDCFDGCLLPPPLKLQDMLPTFWRKLKVTTKASEGFGTLWTDFHEQVSLTL